jgi:hypothetical protein
VTATEDEDHDANEVDADLSSIVELLTFKIPLVMVISSTLTEKL